MGNRLFTFGLAALVVSGCAPSLRVSENEVSQNVSQRLGQGTENRPDLRSDVDALSKWLTSTLSSQLSIDDAVAVALLNNRRLRALYSELGISRADLIDAGLPQNPVFSLERRLRGQAFEVDVGQDFLSFFLIPLRRQVAEAEFEATKSRVTHEILNHAFEVRSAFFELQAEQQMLEMHRTVAGAADAAYEAARKLFEAGNTSKLEFVQEQNARAHARLELANAESEVTQARERINVLLGLWGNETRWTISAHLPELDEKDLDDAHGLEKIAIGNRYDLLESRTELEALAGAAGITDITGLLAELTITGHFEREPEGDSSFGPSIEFPIPLFNFGWGARARARAMLEQAMEKYAALAIEIRSEVRSAYSKMLMARTKAQYFKTAVLPLQQAAVHESQLQYNGMLISVFQLLQARQAQIESGREYIESIRDFWIARTELEKALGTTLSKPVAVEGVPDGELSKEVAS